MLEIIKFPTKKYIMFLCPRCHKIVKKRRLFCDSPNSIYALFTCNDCQSDDNEDIIYYDKYGYTIS